MTALSDLLNELNRENWSTRQIEDRTERLGMKVSNGAVGRYLKGTHPAKPSPRVLKALAAVFRVDENRLREAANQAPTLDRFELPAEADVLDPDERQAVVNLVRVMARNRKAGEQGERDTPSMNNIRSIEETQKRARKTPPSEIEQRAAEKDE